MGFKIFIFLLCLFFFGAASAMSVYDLEFKDRIFKGVKIGEADFGGLTLPEAEEKLLAFNEILHKKGAVFVFEYQGRLTELDLPTFYISNDGSETVDLIGVDVEKTAEELFKYGREGFTKGLLERIKGMFAAQNFQAVLYGSESHFKNTMAEAMTPYIKKAKNAKIIIKNEKTLEAYVKEEEAGSTYDIDKGAEFAIANIKRLSSFPIELEEALDLPEIKKPEAEAMLSKLKDFVDSAKIKIVFTDPTTKDKNQWFLGRQEFIKFQTLKKFNGGTVFALGSEQLIKFLEEQIAPEVEKEARDAKFKIGKDGKVEEFRVAVAGIRIDKDKTISAINTAILESQLQKEINLSVEIEEPRIKTGDVNNLGIKELIGTGWSSYKGSPANRIKNIKNALNKLNGTIIKPGEEFSLLNALRPFTAAGGYLPELVIKGDKIIPEIGGGLCQIGTTTFRAVMNSGLPVIERRNHSIVVTYYNDPANNNPGTDATIYDPSPDFKFKNDYGNHLLLTTEMDEKKGELFFRFWGTADGRKGYYTPPAVKRWRSAGVAKRIKTTELLPGKVQCQSAHPGAEAEFTYIVEYPDGTKKSQIFRSSYRSLPSICLIGATQDEIDADKLAGSAPSSNDAETADVLETQDTAVNLAESADQPSNP